MQTERTSNTGRSTTNIKITRKYRSAYKQIQAHKILSTSMTYHDNIRPQWLSDTQLNYMSQYDFITYDLDEDKIDLIQRPDLPNQLHSSRAANKVQSSKEVNKNNKLNYGKQQIKNKQVQKESTTKKQNNQNKDTLKGQQNQNKQKQKQSKTKNKSKKRVTIQQKSLQKHKSPQTYPKTNKSIITNKNINTSTKLPNQPSSKTTQKQLKTEKLTSQEQNNIIKDQMSCKSKSKSKIQYDYDDCKYEFEQELDRQEDEYQHRHRKKIIAAKFSSLAGHRNARIVYLLKQQCEQLERFQSKIIQSKRNIETTQKQQSQLSPQTQQQQQKLNHNYPNRYLYSFVILPSINFKQQYSIKNILIPDKSVPINDKKNKIKKNMNIICIQNFVYQTDNQYVLFPMLYHAHGNNSKRIAIVYMSMYNNVTITHDLGMVKSHQPEQDSPATIPTTNNNTQKGKFIDANIGKSNLDINKKQVKTKNYMNILKNTSIVFTKEGNKFVVISNNILYLFNISYINSELEQLHACNIHQLFSTIHSLSPSNKHNQIAKTLKKIVSSSAYIPILNKNTSTSQQHQHLHQNQSIEEIPMSKNIYSINISKTYIVLQYKLTLLLFCIQEADLKFCMFYNILKDFTQTSKNNLAQGKTKEMQQHMELNSLKCRQIQVSSMSASYNSSKILISYRNCNVIYQYRVNDICDSIEYVNSIDLENQQGGPVSRVIMSDTGRNVAIITLDQHQTDDKQKRKQKSLDILKFTIFKIQLYTQLGIPQSSLYIKQIKYTNRNRRVNRLVIPKIYEKIYSLTGSQVHTLQGYRISGIFYFDIHPYGFYMVVSYSSNIKIYSLQYNSMTLLYSLSLQNLKKVLYTPDGSCLVMYSSRKLKILDAYSFQVKQQITQKNNSIIDVCFGGRYNNMLILYDNGVIVEKNFYDTDFDRYYDKTQRSRNRVYRVFGSGNKKINAIHIDQRNQNIILQLQDGTILLKYINNYNSAQLHFSYQDEQKISQIYINYKNNLIFIGTCNGILRIHNLAIQKFNVKEYSEIHVSECEITAIACSYLENYVYVGNCKGDITMVKYNPYSQGSLLAKGSKILKNIAPKVSSYFNFDFELISVAKFQGNLQQNTLQDKLQNLIQKIQHHTNGFKKQLISSFAQQQKKYKVQEVEINKTLYKENQCKIKKIKLDERSVKQKYTKSKKDAIEQYETKIKQIFNIQSQLLVLKQQKINCMKQRIRQQQESNMRDIDKLKRQLDLELEKKELQFKKQRFQIQLDFDDISVNQYRMADREALKNLNKNLEEQVQKLKQKSAQLNKTNSYLQTAKINITSRRIQQQTLQNRINQQLKLLSQVKNKQLSKISLLSRQLKSTQDQIHHIQNKVKNTPNNVISSDKADSDLCSYKIWMKNKVQEQVNKLEEYLALLNSNFQKKSQEIIGLSTQYINNQARVQSYSKNINQLKDKLKQLRYQNVMINRCNINLSKDLQNEFDEKLLSPNNNLRLCNHFSKIQTLDTSKNTTKSPHKKADVKTSNKNKQKTHDKVVEYKEQSTPQYEQQKIKKIVSIQKLHEKVLYSQSRNEKIHTRKIVNLNKNNAQLIHQYENLKYENKQLVDKQMAFQIQLKKISQSILAQGRDRHKDNANDIIQQSRVSEQPNTSANIGASKYITKKRFTLKDKSQASIGSKQRNLQFCNIYEVNFENQNQNQNQSAENDLSQNYNHDYDNNVQNGSNNNNNLTNNIEKSHGNSQQSPTNLAQIKKNSIIQQQINNIINSKKIQCVKSRKNKRNQPNSNVNMDKSTLTKFNKDKYINNSFMNTLTHRFTAKNIGSKKNTSKDKNGQMKGIFSQRTSLHKTYNINHQIGNHIENQNNTLNTLNGNEQEKFKNSCRSNRSSCKSIYKKTDPIQDNFYGNNNFKSTLRTDKYGQFQQDIIRQKQQQRQKQEQQQRQRKGSKNFKQKSSIKDRLSKKVEQKVESQFEKYIRQKRLKIKSKNSLNLLGIENQPGLTSTYTPETLNQSIMINTQTLKLANKKATLNNSRIYQKPSKLQNNLNSKYSNFRINNNADHRNIVRSASTSRFF